MPFVYYGGKKGSAHRYPPPAFGTIIEPFAGSAGYALAWAKRSTRVILVEKNPGIVALWRRLQAPDAADDLRNVTAIRGDRADPFVAFTGGGSGAFTTSVVTSRGARDWDDARQRILRVLPLIRGWEIIEGDYTDAPDVRGTWFCDPPYCPRDGRTPGDVYGAATIDYPALGVWCRARQGQVIVCEQQGADWLPFRPLYVQWPASGKGEHVPRVEVVWSRTPGVMQPGTRRRAVADEARQVRRRARG